MPASRVQIVIRSVEHRPRQTVQVFSSVDLHLVEQRNAGFDDYIVQRRAHCPAPRRPAPAWKTFILTRAALRQQCFQISNGRLRMHLGLVDINAKLLFDGGK